MANQLTVKELKEILNAVPDDALLYTEPQNIWKKGNILWLPQVLSVYTKTVYNNKTALIFVTSIE